MTDPQTRIAALVLSGTIERAAQRSQRERSEDVRVALEVAAEVLRQRAGGSPLNLTHDGPRAQARPAPTTKERVEVKEELACLDQLLANRRGIRPRPSRRRPSAKRFIELTKPPPWRGHFVPISEDFAEAWPPARM